MQKLHPIATWNQDKDYWETGEVDIFGRSVAYSVTLPKSGMTRRGRLYELPTSVPLITAPECSLSPGPVKAFPTPKAHDGIMGRPRTTGRPIEKSTHLGTIVTLLPTPRAQAREHPYAREDYHSNLEEWVGHWMEGSLDTTLPNSGGTESQHRRDTAPVLEISEYLPTPAASDGKREDSPSQARRNSPGLTTVSVYFPTSPARDGSSGRGQHQAKRRVGGHTVNLTDAVMTFNGETMPPLFDIGSA